jgi:hypothetical protein
MEGPGRHQAQKVSTGPLCLQEGFVKPAVNDRIYTDALKGLF